MLYPRYQHQPPSPTALQSVNNYVLRTTPCAVAESATATSSTQPWTGKIANPTQNPGSPFLGRRIQVISYPQRRSSLATSYLYLSANSYSYSYSYHHTDQLTTSNMTMTTPVKIYDYDDQPSLVNPQPTTLLFPEPVSPLGSSSSASLYDECVDASHHTVHSVESCMYI
jgi:hypothetical protein